MTPAHRQESGVCAPEGSVGIGQPFPVRERAGTGDAQGVKGRATDSDRIGSADGVQPKRSGNAGRYGIGALGRVVETLVPHWGYVAQAALHLVGDGERGQKLPAGLGCVFGGGQDGRHIVTGMARLPSGQVAVIEVEVPDQRSIIEGRAIWSRLSAADQAAERRASKFIYLLPHEAGWFAIQRANRAGAGIKRPDF